MSASEASFRSVVDPAWSAEQSIVLRYREAVSIFDGEAENRRLRDLLGRASIREGVRLSRWTTENDVHLGVLDETSLMHTGSMKAVDGCVSTAMCLLKGYGRVVFESGGNTGRALTAYLARAGVETVLFVPAENVDQFFCAVGRTRRSWTSMCGGRVTIQTIASATSPGSSIFPRASISACAPARPLNTSANSVKT